MPLLNPKNWPNCIRRLWTRRDLSLLVEELILFGYYMKTVQWPGGIKNRIDVKVWPNGYELNLM